MSGYALGWRADIEPAAKAAWQETGLRPVFLLPGLAAPLPKAFTLADCVLWWYDQGPVGSCFANAVVQAMQISTAAAIRAGAAFKAVQLSRHWAWWQGRELDGGNGFGDGGSVTNALRALHELGCPTEAVCPYQPSHSYLNQKPGQTAYTEAPADTLTGCIDLRIDQSDAIKQSIAAGNPVVIGIWWPYGWDGGSIDQYGRTNGISMGEFGHAIVIQGWADPGTFDDNYLWWHVNNSHGPIYPVLPPQWASRVVGYKTARPDRCYSWWVRDDLMRRVMTGFYEMVAPVGVAGFQERRAVSWHDAMC